MRINAWTEIVAMAVSLACAVFFQLVLPRFSQVQMLFWQKLLWTIGVTTAAWIVATFATPPEDQATIARFKALVRADGRDIGKGVLAAFLAAIAIFASMALVTWLVLRH